MRFLTAKQVYGYQTWLIYSRTELSSKFSPADSEAATKYWTSLFFIVDSKCFIISAS